MGVKQTVVYFYRPDVASGNAALLSGAEENALVEVNQRVAAGQSLDEIMQFFFDSTADIFPCDRIGVAFLEDEERRVVSRWVGARYPGVHLARGYSEGLAGSSLAVLLESKRTRVISNLQVYLTEHPQSNSTKLLLREGVGSSMTCPLMVEGRAVGFLFRSSRHTDAYDEHQVFLQGRLAERLSQAVEKAYRIDRLQAVNRAYLELLSFASHELKSPLASITMDAQALLGGYAGELEPAQESRLRSILRKAEGLLDLTREYLDLSRIEGGHFRFSPQEGLSLRDDILLPVLEMLKPQAEFRRIVIKEELSGKIPALHCDPELLRIVFLNLIGNAIKYGEDGGVVKISISSESGKFSAAVWNSGKGFPPEKASQLFKRFSRLDLPDYRAIRGTGVGLYIAWQIMQLHGGRIRAASEPGAWAEFSFDMPQPLKGLVRDAGS